MSSTSRLCEHVPDVTLMLVRVHTVFQSNKQAFGARLDAAHDQLFNGARPKKLVLEAPIFQPGICYEESVSWQSPLMTVRVISILRS